MSALDATKISGTLQDQIRAFNKGSLKNAQSDKGSPDGSKAVAKPIIVPQDKSAHPLDDLPPPPPVEGFAPPKTVESSDKRDPALDDLPPPPSFLTGDTGSADTAIKTNITFRNVASATLVVATAVLTAAYYSGYFDCVLVSLGLIEAPQSASFWSDPMAWTCQTLGTC